MAALDMIRMKAGAILIDNAFRGLSRLGRLHPMADPGRHGVEVLRDIAYLPTGQRDHTLDVYRPRERRGLLPAVLYIHGGGFRILSKETHWLMALAFARRGHVVFNINYRLAPFARYPAAVEDASAAFVWLARNAASYGGDTGRLILAGESAGANLVTALTVAATMKRPEPHARAVFDTGLVPRAVLPACGLLQVSDPERFARRKPLSVFLTDRINEVSRAYLGRVTANLDLADPLVVFESDTAPDRNIPPFFTFVGTRDPILDDTRRLHAALVRRGVTCEIKYFPGEGHAFHAMMWRRSARACWRATHAFIDQHVLDRNNAVSTARGHG